MNKTSRTHDEAKIESFRRDRAYAAQYLDAVLADGDQEEVMVTLRQLVEALGMRLAVQTLRPQT
jgi:DNA-binding phage protein